MEKLSLNLVQLFLCNKYTVFTMGGTVALQSVNKNFFQRATVLQLIPTNISSRVSFSLTCGLLPDCSVLLNVLLRWDLLPLWLCEKWIRIRNKLKSVVTYLNEFLQIIVNKFIEKCRTSGYQNMTNQLIILSSSHGQHTWAVHLCKQPINTSRPAPAFTVIQVNRCDNYMLDWCVQCKRPDFETWRVKNNEMCVTGPKSWFER